ncbi:hypothetical protein UFOVP1604_83 [uncultured Caudovirales phage]|uniref:Uncharacterized protein n=1 Tax=uncultured Caudovirales phage TaxID=2100421 RepID=A0A6J5SUS5_9CAUD|nr:hypothetical protein UFOVP1604_83 [uncultured Caudovirales phage]
MTTNVTATIEKIRELVEEFPNDMQLGEAVRKLIVHGIDSIVPNKSTTVTKTFDYSKSN